MFLIRRSNWEQFLRHKGLRSDILQPNCIQHAGRGFKQSRRRIARHGFFRQSLDHEAAQLVEVHDVFKLESVAECAAGGDDLDS